MYMRDDKADEVVAKHAEIQRTIRAGLLMGVVPGHGSHLVATIALTFGWMGSSIGAYGLSGNNRIVLVWCLSLSLIFATAMSYLIYRVLRGHGSGRRRLYTLARLLMTFGALVLASAVIRVHGGAVVISSVGVVASAVAVHCIAGANYALFAAFFRAKHEHSSLQESRRRACSAKP